MWFSMPDGCGGITVELQAFDVEIRDDNGKGYFRAPDHFAPRILSIPGFAMAEPPAGAPDDLPKADPLRDGAISELTRRGAAQDIEIKSLSEDLAVERAKNKALESEVGELKKTVAVREATIDSLSEQLEDKPAVPIASAKTK